MVLERPGAVGGVALLERPPDTFIKPKESEESTLGTVKSSLTVIRNPSLEGYTGILMAAKTLLHGDAKSFIDAYVIGAFGSYIDIDPDNLHANILKSENVQKSGNQPLYVVSYQGGGKYPVASHMPHVPCKITDEEFRKFEAALTNPLHSDIQLTGLVNNMMQLMGERLKKEGFAYRGGMLVVPADYASTRI